MSKIFFEVLNLAMGTGPLGCTWEGWAIFLLAVAVLAYMLWRSFSLPKAEVAPAARPGRFRVFRDRKGGYRFNLIAPNNEIIAVSESYGSKRGCMNGIKAVQRLAEGGKGKFNVSQDRRGEYRFNLVAANNEIIARSEGYTAKSSCMNGVESVKRSAVNAVIQDDTK